MTARQPRRPASRRARRLTGATVAGVVLCLGAAAFELSRALGGNSLSWVYTIEWPLIAAYGIYIWHKLISEESQAAQTAQPARPSSTTASTARPSSTTASTATMPEDPPPAAADAGLAAWQDYLSRLHAADPPGGPPAREPHT